MEEVLGSAFSGAAMEDDPGPTQGAPPDHGRGGDRKEGGPQPSVLRTAPPETTGPNAQLKPTLRTGPDPGPAAGTPNPGFVEDPPPYSPPDPKALHLLYPACQTSLPGQGPIFYQPASLQQAWHSLPHMLPGSYLSTIYNAPGFSEIPLEADQRPPPKDYLVESVLVLLFCCLLTGVVALVYSHETRAALNRGDLIQAKAASQKARSLVLFSLLFGLFISVSWVIYVVVVLYL
ncbi:proline rich transmembrane protein 1B [Hemicordylus capensis]|uniref:proline rich transmembrane protein 1B n=1 Tax=Hemicordylus capensis TaxID=884348 RepID=UPI0023038F2D|nr:proline rich transmembrane protein 1B [Hemicordylus capensis]